MYFYMENLPKVDHFRQRYNDLELELSNPDIFKDAERAKSLSRYTTVFDSFLVFMKERPSA